MAYVVSLVTSFATVACLISMGVEFESLIPHVSSCICSNSNSSSGGGGGGVHPKD
eukprot:gene2985-5776_t